jgi:hypothetical protein
VSRQASQRIVDAFLAGDGATLKRLLPPDATFHSPVTDYEGERAGAVLEALTRVVRAPRATSVLADRQEVVAFFTADLEGRRADGVLRVHGSEITLMIRPLRSLQAGIERMKALV